MIRWLGEQRPTCGRGVERVPKRVARGEDDGGAGEHRGNGHTGGEGGQGQAARDHGRCKVSGQV